MKVLPSLVETFLRQREEKKKKSMYTILKREVLFTSNSCCLQEGIPTDRVCKSMFEDNNTDGCSSIGAVLIISMKMK